MPVTYAWRLIPSCLSSHMLAISHTPPLRILGITAASYGENWLLSRRHEYQWYYKAWTFCITIVGHCRSLPVGHYIRTPQEYIGHARRSGCRDYVGWVIGHGHAPKQSLPYNIGSLYQVSVNAAAAEATPGRRYYCHTPVNTVIRYRIEPWFVTCYNTASRHTAVIYRSLSPPVTRILR